LKNVPRKRNLSKATLGLIEWFHAQTDWRKDPFFNKLCIHIADCINCGTISPMEGYELKAFVQEHGYLPLWVTVRESNYSHTVAK